MVERIKMPELPVERRLKSFDEVALGYSEEMARVEASRCLQCKNPPCVKACPLNVNIPAFIRHVREGNYEKAAEIIRSSNCLPVITGRVCPYERQCESACTLGKKGEPVSINALERFISDWELSRGFCIPAKIPEKTKGKKVAIVGSGPAGISAAERLALEGYEVSIFEALHMPGGVPLYGIPEFKLPKDVLLKGLKFLDELDVEILTNVVIGRTLTLNDLLSDGYDAIFLAIGANYPLSLGIPGENLCGVYFASEFLMRINLMRAYKFPHESDTPISVYGHVVVVGGGDVAIDVARCAVRLGADSVTILYRRTEKEMPARKVEVRRAREEGVHFSFLSQPIEFIGDENGRVKAIKCIKMELGPPDETGRRRPIPIPGSEFIVDADTVIVAIGQTVNPLALRGFPHIKLSKKGTIVVDPETLETTYSGIFAGGDAVTGSSTVAMAMSTGRKAAHFIIRHLSR